MENAGIAGRDRRQDQSSEGPVSNDDAYTMPESVEQCANRGGE